MHSERHGTEYSENCRIGKKHWYHTEGDANLYLSFEHKFDRLNPFFLFEKKRQDDDDANHDSP